MNWFIDRNAPKSLSDFLRYRGQPCVHAMEVDWGELPNGKLVDRLYVEGHRVIVTHDKTFAEDEARNRLPKLHDLGVVIIGLRTPPKRAYLELVKKYWDRGPIVPVAGKVVWWPIGADPADIS